MRTKSVKHIFIIYQYFGTPFGGWSTRIYEMSRIWIEQGISITVITSPYYKSDIKPKGFISKQKVDDINLIVVNTADSNKNSLWIRIFKACAFSLIATVYAIKTQAEVIIASSGPITVAVPGLIAKLITKKKLIFEVRDLWPQGAIEMGIIKNKMAIYIGKKIEQFIYLRSDIIIPCSDGMDENIKTRYPNTNTLVISNASDNILFTTHKSNKDLPTWAKDTANMLFIYFGSLGAMDACDEIIKGFNIIKDHIQIHIVFIGDGADKGELINLTKMYDLEKNIHFIPLMPKVQLLEWLKIAKASFVMFKDFPVLSTSSPNKMYDSFALGLPIIQNTTGWIKKLVDETKCGLNIQPGSPASLADAILKIYKMPQHEWLDMSNASLQLALTKFNRSNLSLIYLNKINQLINCN